MLRDVGADDSQPALDMENLPEPARQPMADADTDADQRSSDEIMEPREDAEDALPLGDDDVQPVQGSRSSSSPSSSSSCSDNIEEPEGCPFPVRRNIGGCKLQYEDREALREYRRFILQCNQRPKCTASRKISEQHTPHLGQYELVAYLALWARLGQSVRAPNRSTKGQSSSELSCCRASASGFKTTDSCG